MFWLRTEEIIYVVSTISYLSLERDMGREVSVKVRSSLTMVFGFVSLATGGVDRLRSASRTSALCHEVKKKREKKWS